jgi:hypothetical protein
MRLALVLLLAALPACAQPLVWRFDTDGDMQGWTTYNFQSTEVKGGLLRGLTKYDPMLASPPLSMDAARYPIIEFRAASSVTDGGEVFWHGAGESFSETRMGRHTLQASPEPLVYRVNLGLDPAWRGTITGLRLDLIDEAGATIALDYVRFLERVPGAIPNESFQDDFNADGRPDGWLAQSGTLASSAENVTEGDRSAKVTTGATGKSILLAHAPLDLLGLHSITADLTIVGKATEAAVSLVFYDVFGSKLAGAPYTVRVASPSGKTAIEGSFTSPALAASADVLITVTGANLTAWWDNVQLRHVREDEDLSSAPLETWRAGWIWAADTYGKDHASAFLRRSFDLPCAPAAVTDARVQITADDKYQLWVNGRLVTGTDDTDGWRTPEMIDLKPYLVAGRNVLAVEAQDVASAEGLLLEGTLHAPGQIVELFSDASWRAIGTAPEGWPQPAFDDSSWPAAKIIIAAGGEPWGNIPYTYLGPRESVTLLKADLPAQARAGDRLQVSALIAKLPAAAAKHPLRFALLRDNEVVFARAFGPELVTPTPQGTRLGPVAFTLTRFLPPGKYEIALGYPVTAYGANGLRLGALTVLPPAGPEPPVRAEIKPYNGLPTLFLNGQPNSFMHYLELEVSATRIGNMARNGLHLYELDAKDIGWQGPDQFDYSAWDRRVLELLTYDPDAVIIPTYDISGLAHRFWMDAHPDELCLDAKGSNLVGIYGVGGKIISLASELWRHEYADAVRRFTDHCARAPWGGRIIGYQPCSGVSWEWQHWGSVGPFEPTDYSPPMRQAFRAWVTRKYGGDVTKLRQAWGQPDVTFDTIAIPSAAQRGQSDHFAFRDPSKSAYLIDFYKSHQDVMVDGIEHVFGVIKQANPKLLCGTYYGYTVTMLGGAKRAGDSGHFALARLLDSKLCDFLMSPFDYSNRSVGESYSVMSPIGSVLAHGKLWVLQADLRTHLVTDAAQRRHGSPDSLAGTVSQLLRAFANATAKGAATQWYDFSHGWIARDARQGQVIGKLREISQQWVRSPQRGPDPEGVAVIVDEDSPAAYLGHGYEINYWLVYRMKSVFERIGAPWHIYLLSDVVAGRVPKFRCYFFLNCFHMSDAARGWIKTNLQRDNRTLVWMSAPGYISDTKLDLGGMNELTGMNFREQNEARDWRMTLSATDPLVQNLPAFPQPNMKLGPVFAPQGPGLQTLATWEGSDVPALVVGKRAGWTSIYSAGPLLSAELLQRLCRAAGVPIVVQGTEPSFVSRNLIGLHTAVARTESLRFPQPVTVTDLMTGEVLARNTKALEVKLQGPQTRLLGLQP